MAARFDARRRCPPRADSANDRENGDQAQEGVIGRFARCQVLPHIS
jgi:hypothetical protein